MLSGYKKQYEKSLYEEVEKVKKEISSLKINENKCEDNIVALVAKFVFSIVASIYIPCSLNTVGFTLLILFVVKIFDRK